MNPMVAESVSRRILSQPARRRVFETIQKTPGIHLRRLSREVGQSVNTVDHHARLLERAGMITARQVNRRRSYFVAHEVDARDAAYLYFLRNRKARRLLLALHAEPGASLEQLARHLARATSTVHYHVQKLQRVGLVDCVPAGRCRLYRLAESQEFARILEKYGQTFRSLAPRPSGPADSGSRLVLR